MATYARGSAEEYEHLVRRAKRLHPNMSAKTLRTFATYQLKELLGIEKAGLRGNSSGGVLRFHARSGGYVDRWQADDFVVGNAWDESKHPRADDGKWSDGGGGGRGSSSVDRAAKGAAIGNMLGILAGTAIAGTMVVAPGTSKAVRLLKKLTGVASIRPGAWSPSKTALAAAGFGGTVGSILGGAYGAIRGNAASPVDDINALMKLLAAGDEDALVEGLKEFDRKYDDEVIRALEAAIDADDPDTDDTPDDTKEALKAMHSLNAQVRNRMPNITAHELRTFSDQQKRAIVRGMPPRVTTRAYNVNALWANGPPPNAEMVPASKAEAQYAAIPPCFVANQAVAEATRERRTQDYSDAAPPSSYRANSRIAAARGRVAR